MLNSFSPSLFRINYYLDIYWEVFIHEYFFIRGYLTSVMRPTFSTLNPFYFVGIFIFFARSLYFSIPLSSLMLGPAVYLAVGQTKIKTQSQRSPAGDDLFRRYRTPGVFFHQPVCEAPSRFFHVVVSVACWAIQLNVCGWTTTGNSSKPRHRPFFLFCRGGRRGWRVSTI